MRRKKDMGKQKPCYIRNLDAPISISPPTPIILLVASRTGANTQAGRQAGRQSIGLGCLAAEDRPSDNRPLPSFVSTSTSRPYHSPSFPRGDDLGGFGNNWNEAGRVYVM